MKLAHITTPILACALLTACLVPEKFTAKVAVNPDASYTFNYTGTMVHALVAAKVAKGGKLTDNEELGLKAEAEKMAKNPEVRKAVYKGDARYEVEMQVAKAAGQSFKMDTFSVSTDKDGLILIAGAEMRAKDLQALSQVGIKMDGTIEVSLPKNAEIISHNATSTPSFFGLLGGYSWKIGNVNDRPMMRVKIKT